MNSEGVDMAKGFESRVDVREQMQAVADTIWRLRQPDGCPWDRVQTHESIARNMIEEAYEAVACIEDGDAAHLREELGDVLMQVLLHAQIAADAGEFTLADVASELNDKLIRRHPHVFGPAGTGGAGNGTDVDGSGTGDSATAQVTTADDVRAVWNKVKLEEKAARDADAAAAHERPAGLLDGVPRGLPALMQAQKVSRKAAAEGFDWETTSDVWDKVAEERAEFERETPGSTERSMEFGDLLFALVNVARKEGIDAESALRASTAKFRHRWEAMEEAAWQAGTSVDALDTAALNRLWDEVKGAEAGRR